MDPGGTAGPRQTGVLAVTRAFPANHGWHFHDATSRLGIGSLGHDLSVSLRGRWAMCGLVFSFLNDVWPGSLGLAGSNPVFLVFPSR